jgi:hypothetical protein
VELADLAAELAEARAPRASDRGAPAPAAVDGRGGSQVALGTLPAGAGSALGALASALGRIPVPEPPATAEPGGRAAPIEPLSVTLQKLVANQRRLDASRTQLSG